jgi:cell filamentation protein
VNISRSGQFPFAFSEQIIPCVNKLCGDLERERYLENIAFAKFCARPAHFMGELNAIHPFREGNGRTQREFIRDLALRSGYAVNWTRISGDQMAEASRNSFQRGDNSGLEKALRDALDRDSRR